MREELPVARHRQTEHDQTVILPQTVEQLAASESVPRKRMPRRLVILVLVALLVVGAGAWVLSRQPNPLQLLAPSGTSTPARSNSAIAGFGEASPAVSRSPARASAPSVSPSRSAANTPPSIEQIPALPLLMHYPFNESSGVSAGDVAGGKTAAVAGGAAFVTGRLGNAVKFGNIDQYVSLPAGILSGAPEITVAVWVYLDTVDTWSRVLDFGSNTTVYMFLTPRSDAGKARFSITTGGSGKQERIDAPVPLPARTWTHVAVTLSAGVGILYLNRVEVARTTGMTLTPASLGNTTRNWVGHSQYTADPFLNGTVDDLRIYSRALSAAELASLP
jgi:hypothetical protein